MLTNGIELKMATIDAFIEREKKGLSWYERPLEIWTTKECANPSINTNAPAETVIKRRGKRFYLLIYSGFMLICYLKTPYNKTPFYGMLTIHAIIYLLYLVFSKINPDEDEVSSIKLNKDGIRINKRQINWSDIQKTYIMNTQMKLGKTQGVVSNLIIHKNDDAIEKIDMSLLVISDKQLATLIEYYKNLPK
jgi:hypothetical protein